MYSIVDPAAVGDIAVANAFRAFEPSKQRAKMVSLFRGLCAEAGIIEQARQRSTNRRPRANSTPLRQKKQDTEGTGTPQPPPPPPPADSGTNGSNVVLTQDAMRSMYFQLLLKKAEEGDNPDSGLFGRIERLVGLEPDKEEDRGRTTAGSTPATPADPASQGEG